jgi:prepilin-type N-terminal cleavage/methylation domain-containing protein
MGLDSKSGFTAMEVMISLIVVAIVTSLVMKPVTGILQRMKLQNTAEGVKHLLLNARMRAVSNSQRHCGVVFQLDPNPLIDDKVFAFMDESPFDNIYTKGKDTPYGNAFIIPKKYRIKASIPKNFPTVVVFRADGSANSSAKLALTLNNFIDTVDVLASTGRVKVKVK